MTLATTDKKKLKKIEDQLWAAADKLRKNIDAAEYKHIVLGLIFLKYISDAFEDLYSKLLTGEGEFDGADPEDRDEYSAENVFFVPPSSRWKFIVDSAKTPLIGKILDDAMLSIEAENKDLKSVLPKVYNRGNLDTQSLGGLIDLFNNIDFNEFSEKSSDVLGHVFEYFLGKFALAEGQKGGQFYTPRSVVDLLVEMLEPKNGRVFDPCCGSGGMFVQSEKFVEERKGRISDLSIFGQESNQTTWRLARLNLAIRGIDASGVKWNAEGSFLNDAHPDLRADYIIANPPFNISDWSGELLRDDARWSFLGRPPEGNANYAWIQHFLYHLAPSGTAGFVLAKGALTSNAGGEGELRKQLIEKDMVDCIVNLPAKLFLNTQIPASIWYIKKQKTERKGEILFIDANEKGHLVNRRNKELSNDDIQEIANTYRNWKNNENYEDIAGFCKSATIAEVADKGHVLTPGRFVGIAETQDEYVFEERFAELQAEFTSQLEEEQKLNVSILENLKKVQIDG